MIVCLGCLSGLGATTAGAGERAAVAPETAVSWLREYVQIDTSEPAGERRGAELLAGILRRHGLEPRLLESPGGRTSVYAHWNAAGEEVVDAPALLLMHHIDVVPADGTWEVPPFSGRVVDETLWGRGTLDVKGFGIAQLAALLELKEDVEHRGEDLERDVIFLAVADEERGGREGTAWLLDAHPELFRHVEAVLNEGGANRVQRGHLVWWGVEVAQKRPLWLRITAEAKGGHALEYLPESATHRLVRGLARLLERPTRFRLTAPARVYLDAVGELRGEDDLLAEIESTLGDSGGERAVPGWEVYLADTLQVTEIETGDGGNVVSPRARAHVDLRLLPDTDADALVDEIRRLLGDGLEVEVLVSAPPTSPSPRDGRLWRTLVEVLEERGPVIPTFLPGSTDSRFFRRRGIPAYGFSPFTVDAGDLEGIHGEDERLPVDEFLRGIETMGRVLREYVAPPVESR